jgi:hypothetical protein
LGIRDLFSKRIKDEVVGTKILVASLDPKFVEVANADYRSYSQFYPTPTDSSFERAQDLFDAMGKRYDVVHLFCDVPPVRSAVTMKPMPQAWFHRPT